MCFTRHNPLKFCLTFGVHIRGRGDGPDGSLWRACPGTVSHTAFPLIRDFRSGSAARRSLINPDVLGWPAVLDCRIRLTAFLPSHRTDAAGRSECSTTEPRHHRHELHYPKFRRRRESSSSTSAMVSFSGIYG